MLNRHKKGVLRNNNVYKNKIANSKSYVIYPYNDGNFNTNVQINPSKMVYDQIQTSKNEWNLLESTLQRKSLLKNQNENWDQYNSYKMLPSNFIINQNVPQIAAGRNLKKLNNKINIQNIYYNKKPTAVPPIKIVSNINNFNLLKKLNTKTIKQKNLKVLLIPRQIVNTKTQGRKNLNLNLKRKNSTKEKKAKKQTIKNEKIKLNAK